MGAAGTRAYICVVYCLLTAYRGQDFEWPDTAKPLIPMPTPQELYAARLAAETMQQLTDQGALPNQPRSVRGQGGRHLLVDTYGDSLRFVNSLMNRAFGSSSRKVVPALLLSSACSADKSVCLQVPAHMCHMIDRDIVREIREKYVFVTDFYLFTICLIRWPREWDETSSHHVRSSRDMQYAFTYFYYLMHAREDFDLGKFFRTHLDMDGDGYVQIFFSSVCIILSLCCLLCA